MSRRARRLVARVAAGRQRSGEGRGIITIRHFSRLSGPDPSVNPPRAVAIVVNGNQGQGAASLAVRGTPLAGRFVAGDILRVGDTILVASGDAIATSNAATVPLTATLPLAVTDGAAVTVEWVNEARIAAEISGLGQRVPDGRLIEARDLFITVPAGLLPWEPANGDRITLPSGDTREVVVVAPVLVDGIPISYRLQVR